MRAAQNNSARSCKSLVRAGAVTQLSAQDRTKLTAWAAVKSASLSMQLSGSQRLRREKDLLQRKTWVTHAQLGIEDIIKAISRPDGSLALEVVCSFNCMEINGQFAISLTDEAFWGELGRRFCESQTMGSLSIQGLTIECLPVLQKHFSRAATPLNLIFEMTRDRAAIWDMAFSWMTELLRNNRLNNLSPLHARNLLFSSRHKC
eukprot:m.482545 g.482545  ORF g.482545 m.482545 type:complete len:204 (-) comp57189_c1_seq17:839-1450(-)